MSLFYKELHDRELLLQAELIVKELESRKMVDVFLPEDQPGDAIVFPRRLMSVSVLNDRLALLVESDFFNRIRTGQERS